MLSAESVNLQVDTKSLLENISFTLEPGVFVGLIGPNGAGKSSLLRVLAGLVTPGQGQVLARPDITTPALPLARLDSQVRGRWLAYLAQQEKPAWPLVLEHLVALGRTPWRGLADAHEQDQRAINQALALTDLLPLRQQPVNQISGGELQRALLARVFAGEPQVILADEPIAALDPYHQLHIMELLRAQADRGGIVLAALHDLSLAARYCQRLLLLDQGCLVADGEPVAVLTAENLARVYGITAHVDCREEGVVIIPRQRQQRGA